MGGAPSWDLFIMITFVALVAYGFLLQRDRAVVTMIAIYVGLVLASVASGPIQQFFSGEKAIANQVFIRSSASSFTVQTVVFLVSIGLISAKSGIESRNSNNSMMEVFGFSVLNAALMISSVLLFMEPAKRDAIVEGSKIARMLVQYNVWLLILPVLFLVFTGWNKKNV